MLAQDVLSVGERQWHLRRPVLRPQGPQWVGGRVRGEHRVGHVACPRVTAHTPLPRPRRGAASHTSASRAPTRALPPLLRFARFTQHSTHAAAFVAASIYACMLCRSGLFSDHHLHYYVNSLPCAAHEPPQLPAIIRGLSLHPLPLTAWISRQALLPGCRPSLNNTLPAAVCCSFILQGMGI